MAARGVGILGKGDEAIVDSSGPVKRPRASAPLRPLLARTLLPGVGAASAGSRCPKHCEIAPCLSSVIARMEGVCADAHEPGILVPWLFAARYAFFRGAAYDCVTTDSAWLDVAPARECCAFTVVVEAGCFLRIEARPQ